MPSPTRREALGYVLVGVLVGLVAAAAFPRVRAVVGGPLILGERNVSGTSQTRLWAVANNSVLKVTNKLSGHPALWLEVRDDSTPPMRVSSPALVENLNADMLDGVEAADLQAALGGSVCVGRGIRGFDATGAAVCDPDPPHRVGLDTGDAWDPAIVLGLDGNPIIAHYHTPSQDLIVIDCNDPECSGGDETVTHVDSTGAVGFLPAIVLGPDGNPIVAYANSLFQLKVVDCNDPACSSTGEVVTTVDSSISVGSSIAIALGGDGNPIIAYHDGTNAGVRVADCNDTACTGGGEVFTTVDAGVDNGLDVAMVVGADGNPVIAHYDADQGNLRVTDCDDPACSGIGEVSLPVDVVDDVGRYPSIVLGSDGNPIISYYDADHGTLELVDCHDPGCSSGTITTVDQGNDVGKHTSIVLGLDGFPIISYYDTTDSALRVVDCSATTCRGPKAITTIDGDGVVGQMTAMVLGTDGLPTIAYTAVGGGLKVGRA